jgi:hypothetical protein
MLRTNDNREPRRRRVQSSLTVEGMARERDPACLAQIQARKATLHAQAVLLQAQEPDLEAVGADD